MPLRAVRKKQALTTAPDSRAENRAITGQFKPGQSGNPGGRKKLDPTVRALAREHTPEAVELLMAIARGTDPANVRIDAMDRILWYGWGKPTATLDTSNEGQQGQKIIVEFRR